MKRPTVFVIQNPHQHSGDDLRPKFDLRPAEEFGALVFLLPPSAKPFEPNEKIVEELREKLAQYGDDDHLLLIGNPALIGFACAIAADFNDGVVSVLQWNGTRRAYVSIKARLYRVA